jgi:hypothetical protein
MRYLFVWLAFVTSVSATAQINKVGYFYVNSPNAKKLYTFFKDNFGLPTEWDFQNFDIAGYGRFECGGLSLGNVTLEFVKDSTKTLFFGIELEPIQSAQQMLPVLKKAYVKHDSVKNAMFSNKDTGWSVLNLKGILPEVHLFIVDYKSRQPLLEGRKRAADSLQKGQGGSLGIQRVEEILVGCNNVQECRSELSKIPGIRSERGNLFRFDHGPAIRLTAADKSGVQRVVIKVSSIEAAKKFLQQKSILGSATKSKVAINPVVADGLLIELVDR